MLDQIEINVHDLIAPPHNTSAPTTPPIFEAKLEGKFTAATKNNKKSALLQINIDQRNSSGQLEAAIKLINKQFSAVTILIDMQLALLAYSIIMPYMSHEQLQDIVTRKKLDWIQKNTQTINQITIPWSIATDREKNVALAKANNISKIKEFLHRKYTQKDAHLLRAYLAEAHNITDAQYQRSPDENDKAIENYIIARIATIKAMHTFNNCEHVYIAPHKMHSYKYLQETSALQDLPQYLTLQFTKIAGSNEQELPTSTELNQKLHKLDLIGNISERKSYLENSVKNFPGNVYIESLNSTFLACNKQMSLDLGVEDESYFAGKTFDSILPDDANIIADIVTEITTTNETKVLIEDYPLSGERIPYLTIKMPLRNKKNKTIGIIGYSKKLDHEEAATLNNSKPNNIMQDIIADDNKLSHKKDLYDTSILEHMPGYVFWQDTSGKILGCNHTQALLFGYDSPRALIGKSSSEFLTEKYAKESEISLAQIVTTGNPVIKEEIYKHTDDFMVMLAHKTPVKDDDGKVIGIIVVSIDISKSKKNAIKLEKEKAKLEEANVLKYQFLQDIEHDMRPPFVGLCNMTELCAHKETDVLKRKQLDEISNCAKDLLSYCDALLDFSRNSSIVTNDKVVPIEELTRSVVNLSLVAIRANNLEFQFDYDENIPKKVMGDPYRLKRTLSNLMSNAIKYTNQGHIKLSVKLESSKDDEIIISFSITDSGIGISKKEQKNIFNKYNMLHHEATGQGLGLNEVKRFIEDLKGTVSIDSDTDKGTNITVKLPFSMPSIKDEKSYMSQSPMNKTILVVEDSRITIKFLEGIMTEVGCYSKTVATGKDALSMLAEEHFDILLLDIGLEDTDGYTLARKIRQLELQQKKPPSKIIMMTAQKSRLNPEINKELSVVGQFIKPIKVNELMDTIQDLR